MPVTDALRAGRDAFARRAWVDVVTALGNADAEEPLAAEDLERLAAAAYLAGDDDASAEAWTRAYHAYADAGEPVRAARAAFWLGFQLVSRGDMARAGGWIGRAQRLLDEIDYDGPERALIMTPMGARALFSGDPASGLEIFERVAAIGARFGDTDATTLAAFGRGQALIAMGRITDGIASFDEAMIAVTADEVSPMIAGVVYCGVIGTCYDLFDVGRAREWTTHLTAWCASQPGLATFRGQCLVHRAQLLQLGGEWGDALIEAERARVQLSEPPQPAVGLAYHQLGELHRLRGELDKAEQAYRDASDAGHSPLPGLALLRLAQGKHDAALASVRRALGEARDAGPRSRLLPAAVEIMLACGDVGGARAAAQELSEIARVMKAPYLSALASHAVGAVRVAAGEHADALHELRAAASAWQDLAAPYEAARVRVLIARACRAMGDEEGATLEESAARRVFEELGATPDLAALDGGAARSASGPLSARECEVLTLVARGKTNREVAATLSISEKTVERHLSNIFTKLDLSSRVAATAYAYEHGLV